MNDALRSAQDHDIAVHAEVISGPALVGHVRNRQHPDRVAILEICADGVSLGVVRPDTVVDGETHGFSFPLPPALLACDPLPTLSLCLANSDTVLLRVPIPAQLQPMPTLQTLGEVHWDGGLRLLGRVAASGRGHPTPIHLYEGATEMSAEVTYRFSLDPAYRFGVDIFHATLPTSMADGRPHEVRIVDVEGRALVGSPVTIVAHPSGFRAVLAAAADPGDDTAIELLGRLMDRLLPGAIPFSAYREWADCYADPPSSPRDARLLVASLGGAAQLAGADRDDGSIVTPVALDGGGALFAIAASDWAKLEVAVRDAAPDLILFTCAGAVLYPTAAALLVGAVPSRPCLVYGDVDIEALGGDVQPLLLPAFDRTRWMRQAYAIHAFAVTPDVFADLAKVAPQSLAATLLAALDRLDTLSGSSVVHVPWCIARLPSIDVHAAGRALADHHAARATTQQAELLPSAYVLPAVRLRGPACHDPVDIIIPTKDRLDLLEPCLDSLLTLTPRGAWQVTIVDNGSSDPATRSYLHRLEEAGHARVLSHAGPFNFSRINNHAAACGTAPLLCFLNNDTQVLDGDWLDELRSFVSDPQVAAVGARLLTPDGMVQHGGVVIGPRFAAAHAFDASFATDAGYGDGLLIAREVSALTAACLLVRRADFNAVGGFDESAFPVNFNDVDLCLKLRAMGRRLVWTPHATLLHHESVSRGLDDTPRKQRRLMAELAGLRSRWAAALLADPYYHPCLNLNAHPFSGLAMPPQSRAARVVHLGPSRALDGQAGLDVASVAAR
jgi:GT2 family glycosyltransferase